MGMAAKPTITSTETTSEGMPGPPRPRATERGARAASTRIHEENQVERRPKSTSMVTESSTTRSDHATALREGRSMCTSTSSQSDSSVAVSPRRTTMGRRSRLPSTAISAKEATRTWSNATSRSPGMTPLRSAADPGVTLAMRRRVPSSSGSMPWALRIISPSLAARLSRSPVATRTSKEVLGRMPYTGAAPVPPACVAKATSSSPSNVVCSLRPQKRTRRSSDTMNSMRVALTAVPSTRKRAPAMGSSSGRYNVPRKVSLAVRPTGKPLPVTSTRSPTSTCCGPSSRTSTSGGNPSRSHPVRSKRQSPTARSQRR